MHTLGHPILTDTPIKGHEFDLRQDGKIVARMSVDGCLRLFPGFRHDGATGAIDTPQNMNASRYHDALYSAIAEGLIPFEARKAADLVLFRCMAPSSPIGVVNYALWAFRYFRACYHWLAVRLFGAAHTRP